MGRFAKVIACMGLLMVAGPAQAGADVRVLVDVSDAMAEVDPRALRSGALEAVLQMLPTGAAAGVWSFAAQPRAVVGHATVSALWRKMALIKTRALAAGGTRADLLLALRAATWDHAEATDRVRHLVLVSAAPQPSASREQLLKEELPKLRAAGFSVHAVALGPEADQPLLEQLALGSDGYFRAVTSAPELADALVRVLDHVLPQPRIPEGAAGRFRVDAGVVELTVLRQRAEQQDDLVLESPLGRRYSRTTPRTEVRWHEGENYDLLSLRNPTPGDWRFRAGHTDKTRILALGDLSLRLEGLVGVMFPGGPKSFGLTVHGSDGPITDPQFLSLLRISGDVAGPSERQPLLVEPRSDGTFALELLGLAESGDHVLTVNLEGPTFERRLVVPFVVRHPLTLEFRPAPEGALMWVAVSAPGVDPGTLRVAATVRRPPARAKVLPAQGFPTGLWKVVLPGASGAHEVVVDITGNYLNGKVFTLKTEPLSMTLPVASGATISLDATGKQIRRALKAAAAPEAPPQALPGPIPAAAEQDPAPGEPGPRELPVWFVAVVAAVSFTLVGAFWWLLKPGAPVHPLGERVAELRGLLPRGEAEAA